MLDMEIIDPSEVPICALRDAESVARMMLSTDAISVLEEAGPNPILKYKGES